VLLDPVENFLGVDGCVCPEIGELAGQQALVRARRQSLDKFQNGSRAGTGIRICRRLIRAAQNVRG
jgi:hypothetical protein